MVNIEWKIIAVFLLGLIIGAVIAWFLIIYGTGSMLEMADIQANVTVAINETKLAEQIMIQRELNYGTQ